MVSPKALYAKVVYKYCHFLADFAKINRIINARVSILCMIEFPETLKETSDGTMRITLPRKWVQFEGLKTGDKVKIFIKKVADDTEEIQESN